MNTTTKELTLRFGFFFVKPVSRMHAFKRQSVSFLFLIWSIANLCAIDLAHADFFNWSTRRDLRPEEYGAVVRIQLDNGGFCSGFRVKNDQNRLYIATGRHCLHYKVTEACQKSKLIALGTPGGLSFEATCTRIVAASVKDDMFVFEASLPDSLREAVFKYLEAYSLADYYPAVFAELQMLGFPADNVQNGKPTMSEQCTVKPPESLDIDGKNDPTNYDIQIKPKIGKHNCDVYGGNSGGPIRIRGTHDVIALPASYIPENYQKGSMLASAFMELTKGFIDRNRKSLIAAGVSLSKEPIRSGGNYQYLQKLVKNRNFVSEERPSYRIRISKIDWALGTVEVSFSNNGGQSFNPAVKFVCEDANSHSRNCYHQGNNQTQYGATWYMDLWRDDKILLHFRKGNSMAQDFLTPTQR